MTLYISLKKPSSLYLRGTKILNSLITTNKSSPKIKCTARSTRGGQNPHTLHTNIRACKNLRAI